MTKSENTEWNKMAEENAKQLALLHMHACNAEKTAHALKELAPVVALEFLYTHAHQCRHEKNPNHDKFAAIVGASKIINRKRPTMTSALAKRKSSMRSKSQASHFR